jgi:Uma2 family endonuclease
MERISVGDYFELPESTSPMELVYGVVREPPAPRYGHQLAATHLGALLDQHVRDRGLGEVCLAPVDVVLDAARALVVQPDIIFVARARRAIIGDRVMGPPDLVVEVLSPRTARRDRTTKLGWYQRYGVRECWFVNPAKHSIEVVDLTGPRVRRRTFTGRAVARSVVLPDWEIRVEEL